MVTYVLIHGAGDVGWYWHLVEAELRRRGHDAVAPDLPCDDDTAGPSEYVDVVEAAIGARTPLVVVTQSAGSVAGLLLCERRAVEQLVLVAPILLAPGESMADYWADTDYGREPVGAHEDEIEQFYQDVPPALAAEAVRRGRRQSEARMHEAFSLRAWPDVPTRVVLCRDDRIFPADYLRRVSGERLDITPDELDGGHTPALSRPLELVELLLRVRVGQGS